MLKVVRFLPETLLWPKEVLTPVFLAFDMKTETKLTIFKKFVSYYSKGNIWSTNSSKQNEKTFMWDFCPFLYAVKMQTGNSLGMKKEQTVTQKSIPLMERGAFEPHFF